MLMQRVVPHFKAGRYADGLRACVSQIGARLQALRAADSCQPDLYRDLLYWCGRALKGLTGPWVSFSSRSIAINAPVAGAPAYSYSGGDGGGHGGGDCGGGRAFLSRRLGSRCGMSHDRRRRTGDRRGASGGNVNHDQVRYSRDLCIYRPDVIGVETISRRRTICSWSARSETRASRRGHAPWGGRKVALRLHDGV